MKHRGLMRQGSVKFLDPAEARADLKEGTAVYVSRETKPRTNDQNRYMWAVYRHWAAIFNSALPAGEKPFDENDVHAYWTERRLGRPVDVPGFGVVLKRGHTSTLNTVEETEYIDYMRDQAALRDHYIPDADEWKREQAGLPSQPREAR